MGFIETLIAGLLVALISGTTGYLIKQSQARRNINGAPRKYINRLGEMIERAVRDGKENCIIHGKAIIATRNTLKDSLSSASDKLNSELDVLAKRLGMDYKTKVVESHSGNQRKVNCEEVWESIQVLNEYWPIKKVEIEYEIKKIITELDLGKI